MELYALFDKVVEKHSESEKTKTETTESLCDGFAQLVCRANTRAYVCVRRERELATTHPTRC
jgi:hypothetical protein